MTKKVLFFLTFLLTTLGGGNLAWAQTTVGYTEAISGSTLQARALSNGGLDHLTISAVSHGTNVTDQGSKEVYINGSKYTNNKSWRKEVNTPTFDSNQYVSYSLTIDDGYFLSVSNVAAQLCVSDDVTFNWKVEIENSIGAVVYTSATKTTTRASTPELTETLSPTLTELSGTVTVKLYMYQGGSTKYFSITKLQLGVAVVEDTRTELSTFGAEGTWAPFEYVDNVESSKTSGWYMFKFNDNAATTKVDQTKLSVSSSDESIFTINTYNVGTNSGGSRERINIKIQAVSAGTANVVVSFAGDDNFRPHDPVSIPITTNNIRLASRYGNSYPYTWDFAGKDWSSTIIQLNASDNWNSLANSATNKYGIGAVDCYDIDLLKGLKLTAAASGITADWQNKKLTITGSITLPDLLRGHRVSIVSSAEPSSVPANFTLKSSTVADGKYTNVYFVSAGTTNPEIVFSSATDIYSIAVEKTRAELVLNTTESDNGTSSFLAANPPTLNLGTSQSWGNYCFDIIDGLVTATQTTPSPDYTVTITPAGILHARYGVEWASNNTTRLILTADAVGTAHVSVAINPSGDHGYDVVSPYEFDVRVIQNATPKKWDFENATSYWSTTSGDLNASYWVESSDVANNPGEVMSNVAFNNSELTKDGTNKIPEMEGLVMTAVKGSSRFNIGKYYRLGNYSKASITIPSMTTGQTVTFKVETATSGMERGITATSSNLELISGQVSDKVSYYTFRVTSDGDGEFRQTSEVAGLKIYYIDLKAATPANTGLKFVHGSDDISNTKVNIVSGVTGALDSYFTLSKGGSVDWANVAVTVSPSSLITYDNDGTFTMGSGTGTATITARTTDSSVETGIAVLYVSVKAQPTVTLSADGPFSVNYGQDFNDNTSKVTGTSTPSLPVLYKSSNERVATVDASGKVTCVGVGTTTITAYTEETDDYLPAEASYQLTYNAGNVIFQFEPSEVKLALGKNITPFLHYDQSSSLDPTTLNFTMSKSGIVTCEVVADAKQPDKNVIKITSVDDASKIGETVIVTASVKVRESSTVFYTTVAVTITAAGTRNFSWADGESPTYTMYVGDYMKMPEISGNSNGNDSYSKTDAQKYIYYIEAGKNKVTWNTDGYYLYEGVPDYGIIDNGTEDNNGTHAAIFYAKGQPSNGIPHTLFLYARAAGTVTIRAYDPQNHDLYCDATLKILERTTIDNAASTYINGMKFPYTWDFTGNFDMTDIVANSHYWERFDDNHYAAGIGFFNVDWADRDADDNYNERSFKPFVAGAATETTAGNYMPLFYGLEMSLQNAAYAPKVDRVRITDYNSSNPDAARLVINGGTTQLRLPKAPTQPSNYRIYMKVKSTSGTVIEVGGKKYGVEEYTTGNQLTANTDAIVYFDVNNTTSDVEGTILNLDNVYIYWIATSTEAKNLSYFKHSNSHLTYAAAAYSYPEDLDLSKSNEVNGATAYYASSYIPDNDAQGAYTNEQEQQYAVVMKPLANLGTYVPAGTGMLLKYDDLSGINVSENDAMIPFYMIANPRNVETYSAAETITGDVNYLVGTGANAQQIDGRGTDYTNFMMSAAYKYYTDITDANTAQGGYRFDRDWSFYPVMKPGEVEAQKSYLHIPANLYVDKDGKIVEMPSSSRRTAGESAEAPASKAALAIVFDDDLSNGQGTTGISTVATETTVDSDAWYTLQGVRVETPTKGGIYIHKGRKIVVKL